MKLLSILTMALLALCLVALPVAAQKQVIDTSFIGGEVGFYVQDGFRPTIAIAVTKNFSLNKVPIVGSILGPMCYGWEGSVLYTDRESPITMESDVVRLFYYRVATYKGFFAGFGVGGWQFVNTSGGDASYGAYKAGFGYATGPLIIRIAGDVVKFEKDDGYFLHLGALLDL